MYLSLRQKEADFGQSIEGFAFAEMDSGEQAAMAIDSQGRIVMTGTALVSSDNELCLARFLNESGSLDQRLYSIHDANFNTTSVVSVRGVTVERWSYDPYGVATSLNSSGITSHRSDWVHLHQGLEFSAVSGLYAADHRWYSPTLGRWISQDPNLVHYVDGMNLYEFVMSNPAAHVDPLGLETAGSRASFGPSGRRGITKDNACADHRTNKSKVRHDKHTRRDSGDPEKKDRRMPYSPKGGNKKKKQQKEEEERALEEVAKFLDYLLERCPPALLAALLAAAAAKARGEDDIADAILDDINPLRPPQKKPGSYFNGINQNLGPILLDGFINSIPSPGGGDKNDTDYVGGGGGPF